MSDTHVSQTPKMPEINRSVLQGLWGYSTTITKPKEIEKELEQYTYPGLSPSVSSDGPTHFNDFPVEERYWDFINQDGNFMTA